MNEAEIRILRAIQAGAAETGQALAASSLSKNQLYRALRSLQEQGYVEMHGKKISFKSSAKSILFQDVSKEIDVARVLKNANEKVFRSVIEPVTITELKQKTGLSQSTVKKTVIEMMSFGIVLEKDKKYALNKQNEKVVLFAKLLKEEYERTFAEPYAEIVYRDYQTTLKKVDKGKNATGKLTGMSCFTGYDIAIETSHDYYTTQKTDPSLEEILIHSLCFATGHRGKNERLLTMLCYIANKDMLDTYKIRDIARRYKVDRTWINIESYLRRSNETDMSLFLPWSEFVEKAEMYHISPDQYVIPPAYPTLFDDIGKILRCKVDAYLIGGENMRIKGLKARTKDCDIVVLNKKEMNGMIEALVDMGYKPMGEVPNVEDARIGSSAMLEHVGRTRIDLFLHKIVKTFHVSPEMIKSATAETFSNLCVHMIKNEHVFLLKSAASREGDITDMISIMNTSNFDWNIVWQELKRQEKTTRSDAAEYLLKSLNSVYKMTGTKAPFLKSLMLKVLNAKMVPVISIKKTVAIKDVVEYFEDLGLDEKMVRNGIDRMAKQGMLKKERAGRITAITAKEPAKKGAKRRRPVQP